MTAIKTLQKRIDRLEEQPTTEPDIVESVLADLSGCRSGTFAGVFDSTESGFDEEQIAEMMKDRYRRAKKAVECFQAKYAEIAAMRQKQ